MSSAWKLIIEDDAGKQIVVPFQRDVITIGRKEGNTIRLTERNVSRFHARLAKENGHVCVEDLSSYNGIKLNGDRIAGKVNVNEGDTIQIGDYHLALHAQDGTGAARGAPNGENGQGQHRSAVAAGQAPTADDDEFAGDTQRWEPPAGMAPLSVGGVPTQEEGPVRGPISEETSPAPIATVGGDTQEERPHPAGGAAGGGFGRTNNETERLVLDPQLTPTLRGGGFSGNLEPTVKQAVAAPAPVSGVGKAQTVPHVADSLMAETRPEKAAPNDRSQVSTQPATPAAIPRSPGTASGSKMPAVTDPLGEHTEAMRPAPTAGEDITMPRLVVVNTIFCGSAFRVNAAEAVIGRTEDNDITIEHRSVSRNHAKVVREGDRVRILDLKSANGVLVNGDEVEAAILKSGDIVELGRVRMRFVPIGEKFAVTADEIERARIADAQGDDFENESGTGITNPVRSRQPGQQPTTGSGGDATGGFGLPFTSQRNVVLIGAVGGVVVLIAIVALLFSKGGKDPDEVAVVDAGVVLATIDPPPVDPPPHDPTDVKPPPVDDAAVKPVDPPPDHVDGKPADTHTDDPPVERPRNKTNRKSDAELKRQAQSDLKQLLDEAAQASIRGQKDTCRDKLKKSKQFLQRADDATLQGRYRSLETSKGCGG